MLWVFYFITGGSDLNKLAFIDSRFSLYFVVFGVFNARWFIVVKRTECVFIFVMSAVDVNIYLLGNFQFMNFL